MKIPVGHEYALGIPVIHGFPELRVERFKLGYIGARRLVHGKAHGKALERLHGQIVAFYIVQRKIRDYRSAAGICIYQLLLLEYFEHLAHRRAADVEVLGYLGIGYLFAGPELHYCYPVLHRFQYIGLRRQAVFIVRTAWKRHVLPSVFELFIAIISLQAQLVKSCLAISAVILYNKYL